MYKIAVIPGDGIGPAVISKATQILEATNISFDFQQMQVGYKTFKETGASVSDDTINRIKKTDACLFGATTTPTRTPNYVSAILTLRKELDLHANVRPVKTYLNEGFRREVDLVVVRENTEGLYSGVEFEAEDSAFTVRVITRRASERISRFAFNLAKERRKKLTVVTKANIMRKTCGLFRDVAFEMAKRFPEVEVNELFVDAAAMKLVLEPQMFDVILTSNLFGDILSDEAAGLCGSLGLAASANIGDQYALFEPVHGSAPDIAGKGIANPIAAIRAAGMMLDYLGEHVWAQQIEEAVLKVLKEGKHLTPDIGGHSSINEVAGAILDALEKE